MEIYIDARAELIILPVPLDSLIKTRVLSRLNNENLKSLNDLFPIKNIQIYILVKNNKAFTPGIFY